MEIRRNRTCGIRKSMNWKAISFDWNHVRAFLATAEEGSFSAAARALNTTQPTIGRQVSELERALGVSLLSRSVRGPTLTEVGADLIHYCRSMAEAAMLASVVADGQSQELSGEVSVTATDLISAVVLPKILLPLRESAPRLRVRIISTNQVQDLRRREADIAIRHGPPEDTELHARHVGVLHGNLYAASEYLDRFGRPRTPRDLADHAFVGTPHPALLLAPLQNRGVLLREESFTLRSESNVVVWEHVKAGYGISMLPESFCAAEPNLEKVLPGLPSMEVPVWLVAHRELQASKKVRLVFDHLARGLQDIVEMDTHGSST